MLKRVFLVFCGLLFAILLVGCNNKPNDPVVDDTPKGDEDNQPKTELVFNVPSIALDITSFYPLSYKGYGVSKPTNIKLSDNITVENISLIYKNTPLYQQMNNVLTANNELFKELQVVFNSNINKLVVFDDLSTDNKNLTVPFSIKINKFLRDNNNEVTDYDLTISGTSEQLSLKNFKFTGEFELNIIKQKSENKYQFNLSLKDLQYKIDDKQSYGFNISIVENKSIIIKNYETYTDNNIKFDKRGTVSLVKQAKDYTLIEVESIVNKISNTGGKAVEDKTINQITYYGDNANGSLLNNYENHVYDPSLIDNNYEQATTKHKKYEDFEYFINNIGLVYKSLSGVKKDKVSNKLVTTESAYSGWSGLSISNWSNVNLKGESAVITLNNVKLNNGNPYTQDKLKTHNISYTTYNSSVSEQGKLGFSIVNSNIYSDESLNIFGYFITTNKKLDNLYKLALSFQQKDYPDLEVKMSVRVSLNNILTALYETRAAAEGNPDNNYDIPDIIEKIDEQILNGSNVRVVLGIDRLGKNAIKVFDKNNNLVDFLKINGNYELRGLEQTNDKLFIFGSKDNRPYLMTFTLTSGNKINLNNTYEFHYHLNGIIKYATYDAVTAKFNANYKLFDKNVTEDLQFYEKENMIPVVFRHLDENHNHDTIIVPKYIVIHETANAAPNADALFHYEYFNKPGTNASTHYVVDENIIYHVIPLNERGWHVGDNKNHSDITNNNSIGIEICVNGGADFAKARQNTIDLVIYLLEELNLTPDAVVRHFDASGKQCPATMLQYPWMWEEFEAKVKAGYEQRQLEKIGG